MIAGIIHPGSGLGNQLFRYVAARTFAEDKGFKFGMMGKEYFKGPFIDLDMGVEVPGTLTIVGGGKGIPTSNLAFYQEKKELLGDVDIRGYDYGVLDIQDNTIIDGEFQDEKYWGHKLPDIAKWLKTDALFMPNDVCVIGFRGGEYAAIPDLFLPKAYWEQAIAQMRAINPYMRFMAVTDDVETAKRMLPENVRISHDIATDWRMVRAARYLIIANSSFYILPALINNNVRKVIAPRFWARYNTGIWATAQNCYGKFSHI